MKQKQNETEQLLSTEANRYRLLEESSRFNFEDDWMTEIMYSKQEVIELIQFLAEKEDFKEHSSMSIFIAEDFLKEFLKKIR
mgnify:CR=1 FL=1|tara:strand:+ start:562 stop:807 length:246 start_codon:yes stop_codon:yes gene_type:complete